MYLIIDQPPPMSIMVFLFFLVSSASFGTGNPALPNQSIAETAVRETPALPNQIHRGDRGGTGNPGFAVPDFYPAGLSRAGRFGTEKPCFSVPNCCIGVGLRFFSHGAQTFPVGLRGAAAFCGTNCVKLRSASAPQSGYYF